MTISRIELAIWGAVIASLGAAALGARVPVSLAPEPAPIAIHPAVGAGHRDIDAAASALVATDPFRLARYPSPIPFRPDGDGAMALPPPRPPRPVLSVSGILGGPHWSAVLEGIPGRETGAVVQAGDTLGGLKVRKVERDTVVITGMDTTWRLIVRRAW